MICKCEEPYDETRPMLDCGRCLGWVHGECVPYTCKECEKTEKQGFFDEIERLSVSEIHKDAEIARLQQQLECLLIQM